MEKSNNDKIENSEASVMGDLTDKFLFSNATFKDINGFTDEEMEAIYGIAYNLYNAGKFEEASKLFYFLRYFDYAEAKYWIGSGACKQMLKQYPDAISEYAMASVIDPDDARIFLFVADCNLALNAKEEAKAALELCIDIAGDNSKFAKEKKRAEGLLKLLNK